MALCNMRDLRTPPRDAGHPSSFYRPLILCAIISQFARATEKERTALVGPGFITILDEVVGGRYRPSGPSVSHRTLSGSLFHDPYPWLQLRFPPASQDISRVPCIHPRWGTASHVGTIATWPTKLDAVKLRTTDGSRRRRYLYMPSGWISRSKTKARHRAPLCGRASRGNRPKKNPTSK